MTKKSFTYVISHEEKEETSGSVEFQVFRFSNKIKGLTSQLKLHPKKNYSSQRYAKNSKNTATTTGLFVLKNKLRYKELISQLKICKAKIKTH